MLSTRKSLLVAAALVLGGPAASAADLGGDYGYGTSLKDAPYMAPMPAPSRGWYVRVDGGYNWYTNPGFNVEGCCVASNAYMDGAWSVGGGIGHYFGRGFRGDITVDHIFNADAGSDLDCGCGPGYTKFEFNSTVVLANLYYDFNRGGRFVPYIGAGIGFAHNKTSTGTADDGGGLGGSFASASENHFAAAAMAGVSWRIRGGEPMYVGGGLKDEPVEVSSGHALYLDFGYRFLYLGGVRTGNLVWDNSSPEGVDPEVKDVTAHQFRVGLRYDLN